MRTHRTRLLSTATAVVLTALALTACEEGAGTKDEGASASVSSSKAPTTKETPAAQTNDKAASPKQTKETNTGNAADSADSADSADKSRNSDPNAPSNRVLCNGSNTKVTAQPVSRPLNHMLITVKNTGSKTCDLTYYPVLRFDEMQWAPSAAEETHPQAVTTLTPGQSGYAGVLLSSADGSGEAGTTGHKLTVAFQGATPNSNGGASATPSLPAAGVYYDSTLKVTYWQQEMDDALNY